MVTLTRNALFLIPLLVLVPDVSFSKLTYKGETYKGDSYIGTSFGSILDSIPAPLIAFNFNANEAPTYIDDSGNGRNATCPTECPLWSATSGVGGSGGITFIADGTTVDELLNLTSIPWATTDEFTLSFNIKSTVSGTWGEPFGWIFKSFAAQINIQAAGDTLTAFANITAPLVSTDGTELDASFHHLALVFIGSGSSNPNRISWYIDGIKIAGEDLTGTRTLSNASATIGNNDGGANEIDATLDNFRIHTVALSDPQILVLSVTNVPDL